MRNVHNDKFDVQKIAPLGLRPDLKTSVVPSDDVAAVKVILREYHAMKKETSMYICRLNPQICSEKTRLKTAPADKDLDFRSF